MFNSRYLLEGFWLLVIGTPKSGDVQRCPAELVSSAPDCPTFPTINTLSLQHQHKNHHHHYHHHKIIIIMYIIIIGRIKRAAMKILLN